MKLLLIIIFISILSENNYSQDIIYLKNNDEIKAKVTVVHKNEIWYKKYENLEGPEYKISTRLITLIVYENGHVEQFNVLTHQDSSQNNLISFNVADIFALGLGMSYTRYLFKKKVNFKIPVSGFLLPNYLIPNYSTGLDLNFSPLGLKKFNFYFGVGSRVGHFNFDLSSYGYNYSFYNKNFWGLYFNNGVSTIVGEHFVISTQLGLGFRDIDKKLTQSVIGEINLSIFF